MHKKLGIELISEPGLQIQHTIAENFITASRVLIHAAAIARVMRCAYGTVAMQS